MWTETHTGVTRSTVCVTHGNWRSLLLWTLTSSGTRSWVLEQAWGPVGCVFQWWVTFQNIQNILCCIQLASLLFCVFQHTLAEVWVQKTSEMDTSQQYHCRTFLGHLLNIGDLVLGCAPTQLRHWSNSCSYSFALNSTLNLCSTGLTLPILTSMMSIWIRWTLTTFLMW